MCVDGDGLILRSGGCENPRPSVKPYRTKGEAHPNAHLRIQVTDWSNRGREL